MTLISRFRDKSFNVFLWGLVLVAVLHSFTIAKYFLLSGYWDDTILFVGIVDSAPSNPIRALIWILNQSGDLNGPLVNTLLYGLNITGLLSNYSLILFSNLALVALIGLLAHVAIKLGASAGLSFLTGVLLYFAPILIEQRTWPVAIQHTLTVFFSVAACYMTYEIASTPNVTRQRTLIQLSLLNVILIMLAFGRETGIPLSIVVIATLGILRVRFISALVLGWLIPLVFQVHRLGTGRLGTHVGWSVDDFTRHIRYYLGQIANAITPAQLLLFCIVVIPLTQLATLRRDRTVARDVRSVRTLRKIISPVNRRGLLFCVCSLLYLYPAAGTPLMGLLPPLSAFGREQLVLGRWSQFGFSDSIYLSVLTAFVGVAIIINSIRLNKLLAVTVLCTAPYLLMGDSLTINLFGKSPSSLSRYSLYFVPLAYVFILDLLAWLKIRRLRNRTYYQALFLVTVSLWLIPQASQQQDSLIHRSAEFSSISVHRCGATSYVRLSGMGNWYVNAYVKDFVANPELAIFNDPGLKSRLPKSANMSAATDGEFLLDCFDQLTTEFLFDNIAQLISIANDRLLDDRIDDLRGLPQPRDQRETREKLREVLEDAVQSGVIN